MSQEPTTASPRVAMFDGLRGYAIVLVVLSHLWTLSALSEDASRATRILFGSGDFAVTVFFVISGYLATAAMLRRVGRVHPGVITLRRWARLSAHVYFLVVVLMVVTAVSTTTASYAQYNNAASLWYVLTYRWPSYLQHHALEARPDLGNLWYVSVDLWGIALIAVLVALLGRYRAGLLAALLAVAALSFAYRQHVLATHGELSALIQLGCRIDGPIWGAVAATVAPWLRPLIGRPAMVAVPLLALLVPLAAWTYDVPAYLGPGGLALHLALALLVIAIPMVRTNRFLSYVLEQRALAFLGRNSYGIYIWHYPVFWYVAQHYVDWRPAAKIALGLLLTAALAAIFTLIAERPVRRWLGSPAWRSLDDGIPIALWRLAREKRGRLPWRRGREPGRPATQPPDHPAPGDRR